MENFIVALRNHRILGYILSPFYAIYDEKRQFWSLKAPVTLDDIEANPLGEDEEKVVKYAAKYSDSEIFKLFGKRQRSKAKSVQDFYNRLSTEDIEKKIRPYVEKHLSRLIDFLRHTEIPVFLKERKYDNLYKNDRLTVFSQLAETAFHFSHDAEGIKYHLTVYHDGTEKALTGKFSVLLCHNPAVLLLEDAIYVFRDIDGKKLLPFFTKSHLRIPKRKEDEYFQGFLKNAIKKYRVIPHGFTIKEKNASIKPVLELKESIDNYLMLELVFYYDGFRINRDSTEDTLVTYRRGEQVAYTKIPRNRAKEQEIDEALLNRGLARYYETGYRPASPWEEDVNYSVVAWVNMNRKELDKLGIRLKSDFNEKWFLGKISLHTQMDEKVDWFDIYAEVTFGEFRIPFYKLRKHIISGQREYKLPDGSVALLPADWFAMYTELLAMASGEGKHLYLRKHHFALVKEHFGMRVMENQYAYNQLFDRKPDYSVKQPAALNAELRYYQHEGFVWLYYLYKNHFGGCLADDMGLGKTLQALTLLLKAREEHEAARQPAEMQLSLFNNEQGKQPDGNTKGDAHTRLTSLVVMPTSLLHNWENEIGKFAPQLNVMRYVGQREGKIAGFADFDIVLTSYGIVRNDYKQLSEFQFFYVILDESQYIKNPGSKIYNAISELSSAHRLVLTGTPIENTLTDLWAQLNFLNEGLLGSYNYFRDNFVIPIERYKQEEREQQLQSMIRPFLLRRKKSDVAKELPPVSEQMYFCELTPEQRKIYETHKSTIRNKLLMDMEGGSTKTSNMLILKSLNELRQLSNHPAMLYPNYEGESGKFNEIVRAVSSVVAEGNKVILFSSFVKHLNLIARYLDAQGYTYLKLTGATQNREMVVDKFQNDATYQIFLMSLKAGGVGLNLTAAGYVFIVDPWWNPATELQAVNRAHRIGQDKNVFVYRFITRDTIEEKIQNLQKRKMELANTYINSNDPFRRDAVARIAEMSREEIMQLRVDEQRKQSMDEIRKLLQ